MVSRFGRYELLRSLGRGGMAEVFLARQRGMGGFEKRLVIKRILPLYAQDPRFLRLFFEEARLHAGLNHGNLVSIFDFGRVGNDYFLAMELVDGCDLATLLRVAPDHRLPDELVAYIGAELCRALQHVHRRPLVHRDLTPRNVLLSLDGEVKLADFGVARDANESAAGVRGTLAYMAPEQAGGQAVDARADLYALGMLIAEAATGARVRRASAGEAREAQLAEVAKAVAVRIDGPFAELVARATAPAPADRYADAEQMAVALEALSVQLGSSRAHAARTLAERVRAAAPRQEHDEHEGAPALDAGGPATYFRDAATDASVVDEILAAPPPAAAGAVRPGRARSKVLALTAAAAGIAAMGIAAAGGLLHGRPRAATDTRAAAPPPRPVPTPISPPDLSGAPEPATTAPAAPHLHHREPTPATGTVEIRCQPWCMVAVDGQPAGEDGRHHLLRLTAGRHRLVVERLEDRQQRTVEVGAGRVATIDFAFD